MRRKHLALLIGSLLVASGLALAAPGILGQILLLEKLATGSFPAASATNEGGLLYDDTINFPKYSDGATWNSMAGAGGTPTNNGGGVVGICTVGLGNCTVGGTLDGAFRPTVAGGTFQNLIANFASFGAVGAGTITFRVQNITDASTLCSCTIASCNPANFTAQTCTCGGVFAANKTYVIQITAATCAPLPNNIIAGLSLEP